MASKEPKPQPVRTMSQEMRRQIEAALAEGASREGLVLHLTLGDANRLKGDRDVPVEDISFSGGVMRYLGVTVVQGGVAASCLELAS